MQESVGTNCNEVIIREKTCVWWSLAPVLQNSFKGSYTAFLWQGEKCTRFPFKGEWLSFVLSLWVLLPQAPSCRSSSTSHIYSHLLRNSSCSWRVCVFWESCCPRRLVRRDVSFLEPVPSTKGPKASVTDWNSFLQISGKLKRSLGVSDGYENFILNSKCFFPAVNLTLITH